MPFYFKLLTETLQQACYLQPCMVMTIKTDDDLLYGNRWWRFGDFISFLTEKTECVSCMRQNTSWPSPALTLRGTDSAHTASRLSVYQIHKCLNVCAAAVRACELDFWLQQRPVESCRSWLTSSGWKWMLKQAKYCEPMQSERKQRRGLVCELRRVSLPQGWRGWVRTEHRWVLAQVKL